MVEACEICGEKPAVATCRICGRHVCSGHISEDGVCSVCMETLCSICGRRLSIGYCVICGRIGCDQCLIQVDNVRRVCVDCPRKLAPRGESLRAKVLEVVRMGLRLEGGEPI